MAFSTFVFDTLDVATRLGRYILQELTGKKGLAAGMLATAATVGVPLLFILNSGSGSYRAFWTLFGTSNQLLAALTLLGITVWLRRSGRRYGYTFWPMLFVMTITVWSLVLQAGAGLRSLAKDGLTLPAINGIVAVVLLVLAGTLVIEAIASVVRGPPQPEPGAA
jgi:carbon starvation protein